MFRSRARFGAFLLTGALALGVGVGCGSDGGDGGQATTAGQTPTTSSSVSTEGGSLSVAAAGEAYLALVDSKNDAVATTSDRFETAQLEGDLTEVAAAMTDFGQANREFAERLASTSWPEAVEGDVAVLVAAAEAEAEAADAYAESILAFDDAEATAEDTEVVARGLFEATGATLDAAAPVRKTLGLPPVPGR